MIVFHWALVVYLVVSPTHATYLQALDVASCSSTLCQCYFGFTMAMNRSHALEYCSSRSMDLLDVPYSGEGLPSSYNQLIITYDIQDISIWLKELTHVLGTSAEGQVERRPITFSNESEHIVVCQKDAADLSMWVQTSEDFQCDGDSPMSTNRTRYCHHLQCHDLHPKILETYLNGTEDECGYNDTYEETSVPCATLANLAEGVARTVVYNSPSNVLLNHSCSPGFMPVDGNSSVLDYTGTGEAGPVLFMCEEITCESNTNHSLLGVVQKTFSAKFGHSVILECKNGTRLADGSTTQVAVCTPKREFLLQENPYCLLQWNNDNSYLLGDQCLTGGQDVAPYGSVARHCPLVAFHTGNVSMDHVVEYAVNNSIQEFWVNTDTNKTVDDLRAMSSCPYAFRISTGEASAGTEPNSVGASYALGNRSCSDRLKFICDVDIVKGIYNEWSEWSNCTNEQQTRNRSCNLDLQPVCDKNPCSDILEQNRSCCNNNGTQYPHALISDSSAIVQYAHTVHYMCDYGHTIIGDAAQRRSPPLSCIGGFLGFQPEHNFTGCQRLSCGTPTPGRNYTIQADNFLFMSKILYECDEGYFVKGTNEVKTVAAICLGSREWSHAGIDCRPVTCSVPARLNNSKTASVEITSANLAILEPDIPSMEEEAIDTVYQDPVMEIDLGQEERDTIGVTNDNYLTTDDDTTEEPTVMPTVVAEMAGDELLTTVTYQDRVSVVCKEGFELDATRPRIDFTCESTGLLEPSEIHQCDDTACFEEAPKPTPNSYIEFEYLGQSYASDSDMRFVGTIATYQCARGYRQLYNVDGLVQWTCSTDRKWKGSTTLACERVRCEPPPLGVNIRQRSGDMRPVFVYEDAVIYYCDMGWAINGKSSSGMSYAIRCEADAQWSETDLECKQINCGDPGDTETTIRTAAGYLYGDIVNFTCLPKHTIDGTEDNTNMTARCAEDSEWNSIGLDSQVPPNCVFSNRITTDVHGEYTAVAELKLTWIQTLAYKQQEVSYRASIQGYTPEEGRQEVDITYNLKAKFGSEVQSDTIWVLPGYDYKIWVLGESGNVTEGVDRKAHVEFYAYTGVPTLWDGYLPEHVTPVVVEEETRRLETNSVLEFQSYFSPYNGFVTKVSIIVAELNPRAPKGYYERRFSRNLKKYQDIQPKDIPEFIWPPYEANKPCDLFSGYDCEDIPIELEWEMYEGWDDLWQWRKRRAAVAASDPIFFDGGSGPTPEPIFIDDNNKADIGKPPANFPAGVFIVGADPKCSQDTETYCNGPIRITSSFCFKLRAYTRDDYYDSPCATRQESAGAFIVRLEKARFIPFALSFVPFGAVVISSIVSFFIKRSKALKADDIKTQTEGAPKEKETLTSLLIVDDLDSEREKQRKRRSLSQSVAMRRRITSLPFQEIGTGYAAGGTMHHTSLPSVVDEEDAASPGWRQKRVRDQSFSVRREEDASSGNTEFDQGQMAPLGESSEDVTISTSGLSVDSIRAFFEDRYQPV